MKNSKGGNEYLEMQRKIDILKQFSKFNEMKYKTEVDLGHFSFKLEIVAI